MWLGFSRVFSVRATVRNEGRTSKIRPHRGTTGVFGQYLLAMILVLALAGSLSAAPMVYSGIVVTDVRVGRTLLHNASLKITFEATRTIFSKSWLQARRIRFPVRSVSELPTSFT